MKNVLIQSLLAVAVALTTATTSTSSSTSKTTTTTTTSKTSSTISSTKTSTTSGNSITSSVTSSISGAMFQPLAAVATKTTSASVMISTNGVCDGKTLLCENNNCCSINFYCYDPTNPNENESDYCSSENCLSGKCWGTVTSTAAPTATYISTDNRCDGKFKVCKNNNCCSTSFWCYDPTKSFEIQSQYCGLGNCLSGACWNSTVSITSSSITSTKTTTTTTTTTKKTTTTKTTKTKTTTTAKSQPTIVSTDGTCGLNKICQDSSCCSLSGFCYMGYPEQNPADYCSIDNCMMNCWNGTTGTQDISMNVYYSCNNPMEISLTYDDGISVYDPQLLQILANNNVPATFCLIGYNMQSYPDIVLQMYNNGLITLCSHTYQHLDLQTLSAKDAAYQLSQNEAIAQGILGSGFKFEYFRPPYSSFNWTTYQVIKQFNYQVLLVGLDVQDYIYPDDPNIIMNTLISSLNNPMMTPGGPIVCAHDLIQNTVLASDAMIKYIKAQGYKFVPIKQCIGI